MSSTTYQFSATAGKIASIAAIIAAALPSTSAAGQDIGVAAGIANDLSADTAAGVSFEQLLQEAALGQIGDQVASLFFLHVDASDAATAAVEQWNEKAPAYQAMASPQGAYDAMKADVFGEIKHDSRGKPGGFLTDAVFAFEEVRGKVWDYAAVATDALLQAQMPAWAGKYTVPALHYPPSPAPSAS